MARRLRYHSAPVCSARLGKQWNRKEEASGKVRMEWSVRMDGSNYGCREISGGSL